jgi:dihydroorotate dehydrogenase
MRSPAGQRSRGCFRYPAQEAVINRMGFNNEGPRPWPRGWPGMPGPGPARRIPLGHQSRQVEGGADRPGRGGLSGSFARLADHADYLVLNVSSPNTPTCASCRTSPPARAARGGVRRQPRPRRAARQARVPLLLKIAPDLTWPQIDAVLGVIAEFRSTASSPPTPRWPGRGSSRRSGSRRTQRRAAAPALDRDRQLHRPGDAGRLPIIGVGGITVDVESAAEKLDAGATLVQVYTGMIYRGPFFAAELARASGSGSGSEIRAGSRENRFPPAFSGLDNPGPISLSPPSSLGNAQVVELVDTHV